MTDKHNKKYVVALDQGTTSSRAIVFDRDANVVSQAQREFAQFYPQAGWVEHDAEEIWSNTREVVGQALGKGNVSSGDIAAAIRALETDAAERGEPLRLVCLTPPQMAELEEFFPGRFTCTADRDGYDYLYDIDRLADLGGKKLHAKRNHIHRFVENNPTWAYEEITPASLPECLKMDQEWYRRSLQREGEVEERDLGDEGIALRAAMEHYEELGLEGGLIRVYGEVVAFTIGDRLSADTYDVHFEKAYGELQGAYAMINREFARWVREHHPEIKYLNREDDMGVPGLRKAKESYYPDLLVEKHTAILQRP